MTSSARTWAKRLGVDPYSSNPVLHAALVDVGKIDSAGRILAKVVVPIPAVASATAAASDLVWAMDAEDLRIRNEGRLATLGVSKDVVSRFFCNRNYSPTGQTRFVEALFAVKAKGCADYVDAATEAADERDALFFVESAEMLAALHQTTPVA